MRDWWTGWDLWSERKGIQRRENTTELSFCCETERKKKPSFGNPQSAGKAAKDYIVNIIFLYSEKRNTAKKKEHEKEAVKNIYFSGFFCCDLF